MAISTNHTASAMQSALTNYNFIKIHSTQGSTINSNYSIGAYPTFILIKPDKSIVEKDIWPIDNTILRTKITNAGGTPQSCATGIVDAPVAAGFNVYPVPATNTITIESGMKVSTRFEIVNVTGQMVLNGTIDRSGIKHISVSELPEGQYFVKLFNNTEPSGVRKFVVIR